MHAKNSKCFSKMNTNPDEIKVAAWLDGAQQGEELAVFEVWLNNQPDRADYFMKREDFAGIMLPIGNALLLWRPIQPSID